MSDQLPVITQDGISVLDTLLEQHVAQAKTPAVFWLATNAKEAIYSNQAGHLIMGDATAGQVNEDTTMELFSQTKLITSIAVLQLVDRGLVSLDSEEDIEKYLPELQVLEILTGYGDDGKPTTIKPKGKITLRMLMSHTSGCVYNIPGFRPTLHEKYFEDTPNLGHVHPKVTINDTCWPLSFEPGTSYLYSPGMDFTGKLIERVSGLRPDKYFQQYIFDPLGLSTLGFFPTETIKKEKMALCVRLADGSLTTFPGGFLPGRGQIVEDVSTEFLSGGAGLFGTLKDFLVILRAVLQADPSSPYHSDNPIISPNSFKELFTGCINTELGRKALAGSIAGEGSYDTPPDPSEVDQSVGFLLSLSDASRGGRKKGSGSWYGIAHTHFWIDPASGVAGITGTQLIASNPDPWFGVSAEFEKMLYANLE